MSDIDKRDKILNSINYALSETLEHMAFIEVREEKIVDESNSIPDNLIFYTISTKKDDGLDLCFASTDELFKHIVENIFGSDEFSESEFNDNMLEITNIIMGNFLDHYFDGKVTYNLTLPIKSNKKDLKQSCTNKDDYIICSFKLDNKLSYIILNNVKNI